MSKSILIGSRFYRTKAAATEAVREVLHRYPPGAMLTGEDADFVADLLDRHPERDLKVGVGVASFHVQRDGWGGVCFGLTRTDGTRTDFGGISKCLEPPSPEARARAAFRNEVTSQVIAFRDGMREEHGSFVRCAVTNALIQIDDAHVDHADPTFEALLAGFLPTRGLALGVVDVQPTRDNETMALLADRALAKAWFDYHHTHKKLRIVSRYANLSLLRRARGARGG